MTDVFIISSMGALGLLYGVSRLRYSLKSKKLSRKHSSIPSKKHSRKHSSIPSKKHSSIPSKKHSTLQSSIHSSIPLIKPVTPFPIIKSNMNSKLLFTTGELKIEDIEYYNPEIIILDNPKILKLDYEFSGDKTIQIYWTNYIKLKTYSEFYCYGIKLKNDKNDKILNIIVIHLISKLEGDELINLTLYLQNCLEGLEIKDKEDIIITGNLNIDKKTFFIKNKVFYSKSSSNLIYANTNFKSINMDSNGVTMVNYTLDEYIMFHKEWVIPQPKYIDLVKKFTNVGYDISYHKKSDLYRIDQYRLKKIDNYIQIQKGNKKWIMVKIDDIIKSNIKVVSKQVLVKENDKYSIQTDYKGNKPTYNLPIHK